MIKQFLIILLLVLATNVFGQPTTNPAIKTDYLKKSKKQKNAAWLLLGGGATITIIGIAIPSHVTDYGNPLNPYDDKYSNDWGAITIPGVLAMAGSIPIFIASEKNK